MAQQTPPYVISAATHSAALFRQANDAPFVRRGVVGVSEYAVAQQASPNMSVQVSAGRVVVPGTQGVTPSGFTWSTQGSYFAENDASATVTIAASNPTNPRIDVVYVAVQDAFYSGSNNQVVLAVATGTPSATPAVPAIPANAVALAQVAVGANVSTIVNANISNLANVASAVAICLGGIMPVANVAGRPASPYKGQYIDDAAWGLFRYDGTTWSRPGGPALQYRQDTAQSLTTGVTTVVNNMNTKDYDNINSGFNAGTGVFTVPTGLGGYWEAVVQTVVNNGSATFFNCGIQINGSTSFNARTPPGASFTCAPFGPYIVNVADGGTIAMTILANGTGAVTNVAVTFPTFIRLRKVA